MVRNILAVLFLVATVSSAPGGSYGVGHHGGNYGGGHHAVGTSGVHYGGNYGGEHHAVGNGGGHHAKNYGGGHHGGAGYGHYTPAKYDFSYGVSDPHYGANFGHSESRDGYTTKGEYYVNLPDGRLQKVTYYADQYGYHPTVTYEGKAHFPSYGKGYH